MTKQEYISPMVESIEVGSMTCVMTSGTGGLGEMEENPIISMYP